jgi:hypothetical protein
MAVAVVRRDRKTEKRLEASTRTAVRLTAHMVQTRLPLDGFSCNFIYEYFSKICRENSSFIINYDNNNGYFT